MERIVYTSIAADALPTQEVFRIVETSERNNPKRDVTGFLIHDSDRFLQLIEGPPMAVEALVAEIETDPRHHSFEVRLRSTAEERWFPDWEMKRLITFGSTPALEEIRQRIENLDGGEIVLDTIKRFIES